MKHEVILRFCFWEFEDIMPDEITHFLGIEPYKIFIKGEQKDPKFPALSKHNGWLMDSSLDKYSSFEDQMESILNIIDSKIDLFKPLCEKYYSEFSCAIFLRFESEESKPAIHLDEKYNRINKIIKAEFDFDLYCLANH
jgi:Domain of unknown function (DUF4279)